MKMIMICSKYEKVVLIYLDLLIIKYEEAQQKIRKEILLIGRQRAEIKEEEKKGRIGEGR